jgi:hypothetical protein
LAVHNGVLYAAWKGLAADADEGMYWSTFNGTVWSNQQKMPIGQSSVGPALAEFNGKLYAAWKGFGDDSRLYWSALS